MSERGRVGSFSTSRFRGSVRENGASPETPDLAATATSAKPALAGRGTCQQLLSEGRSAAASVVRRQTLFHELRGVRSQTEWARRAQQQGGMRAIINIGAPDWEGTKDGLRELWRAFQVEALTPPDAYQLIMERRMGLPEEMRASAPQETGPALWTEEDWLELGHVVPIQPQLPVIGSPASFENALLCLRAGVDTLGNFCEFTWRWPYWDDEVAQLSAIVRALGAVAALRSEGVVVDSYLEDGFAGEFDDYGSVVGWSLLERYLVDDLCGAAYSPSFGGLTTATFTRIAVFQAIQLAAGGRGMSSFVHGDTVGYSTSEPRNRALFTHDALLTAAANRHYGWPSALLPVPLTEFERVPAISEIVEVHETLRALEPLAVDLADRVDWEPTDADARAVAASGGRWFRRLMANLEATGVRVDDALAIMLALRRLGRAAVEQVGLGDEKDRFPTDLANMAKDRSTDALQAVGDARAGRIDGLSVAVVSTDVHVYAKQVLKDVMEDRGAQVVDCGVSADPERLVEMARERDCAAIVVTTHNGWALNFGQRLMDAIGEDAGLRVVMGGYLNESIAGAPVPQDVSHELRGLGIETTSDLVRLVELLRELERE